MNEKDKPLLMTSPVITPSLLGETGVALTADDVAFLKMLGIVRHCPKDSVIARQGDYIDKLMFILKGLARITCMGADGAERTFLYFSAGCFVGAEGFLHHQPIIFDLRVIEDADILFIDAHAFPGFLPRRNLCLYLLKSIALVSRVLAHQIEDAAFRTTEQAICRILYCLSDDAQLTYKPHFTHQEIADLVGVHRVTVTHILGLLKKEGLVHIQPRGRIIVASRDKLHDKIYTGG
ncbi:MAG TPA: Crp/Fnr family transcriptional regulator [Negativicutes bacterium]|nr:Crp/Fnr family transcriptional regulator [Negativicutes bacterium]